MSALLFGSPEAAAQLRKDAGIEELEKLARSRREHNYCIDPNDIPAHLYPVIDWLVQRREWVHWRETQEGEDGDVTVMEDCYQPKMETTQRWDREVQP